MFQNCFLLLIDIIVHIKNNYTVLSIQQVSLTNHFYTIFFLFFFMASFFAELQCIRKLHEVTMFHQTNTNGNFIG
jgi:hypothetical protein